MDIKAYLSKKREIIDSFFQDYFGSPFRPEVLHEAMRYSLFAGGKRIRPILALASFEACGGDSSDIVPYAAALELIHTYSLIHDDLPAMDNDDLRRGKPTNHRVYGEATAILAGDALLTEAFCMLSDPSLGRGIRESDLLKVSHEIAYASGARGMVAGQMQDMLSENAGPDIDTLHFIHKHKTTALLRASVRTGAVLAGSGPDRLDALTRYGDSIGLTFQVIDDILDVEGETEVIGKPKGSDEKKRKMTYPRLYGIEKSREIAHTLIKDAISALSIFSSEADPLREIAYYLQQRKS